jgi:peptidoglycan hydrolase-like protein with peptidoglycan-binding domain
MQVPYSGIALHVGSRGDPVYAVKRAMQKTGFFDRIGPHRIYGPRFADAVALFQAANNLAPDGKIGRQTLQDARPVLRQLRVPALHRTVPRTCRRCSSPRRSSRRIRRVGSTGSPRSTASPSTEPTCSHPRTSRSSGRTSSPGTRPPTSAAGHATSKATTAPTSSRTSTTSRNAGSTAKGTKIGTVAAVPHQWWPSHIHEGKHKGHYTPAQP